MRAIQVKCPNCAAALQADEAATSIECEYCHTKSAIQRRSRVMQIPVKVDLGDGQRAARQKVNRTVLAVVLAFVGLPILSGLVITVCVVHKVTTSFSTENVAQTAADDIRKQAEAQIAQAFGKAGVKLQIGPGGRDPSSEWQWQGTGAVLLYDVDGDRVADVIGRTRYVSDGDRIHIAAFSGATGRRLWESPTIGSNNETYQGTLLLIGDLLLFAEPTATITAYDVAGGARRWAVQLPDRSETACFTGAGTLHIKTVDGAWHAIAADDGARSDGAPSGSCLVVPDDRLPGAPTLVRGRPQGRLDVDGMRVSEVIRLGEDGPQVAIGTRDKGTAVPLVARLEGRRAAWVAEIPSHSPLQARASEELVAMTPDRVCTIYQLDSGTAPRLTCFDLATGGRTWDTQVAKGTTIVMEGLVADGGRVFLSSWGHVEVFDLTTGRQLHIIGDL
jgi:DNA-directed RNA polymerase subunit RPC12/RpoP